MSFLCFRTFCLDRVNGRMGRKGVRRKKVVGLSLEYIGPVEIFSVLAIYLSRSDGSLRADWPKARLIGQGYQMVFVFHMVGTMCGADFLVSAAVAEFKGPAIFGVVRLAQVNMELARIEANFSGLPPGKHGWSINEFGDLTRGAASTGKVFNPTTDEKEPLGDLGTLEVDEKGEAFFSGVKEKLRVGELIGRSIVVYGTEDKSDEGIAAAVVARSAGVGENYKKLCTCDGTTIWEATNADFVTSKV
ncbi:UNVERIFIED_CONTAM: Copper chaperone for superoxide dismutase, chloroplastic/cytosolic [Sesamum radiatum]|uniref:Copper chaperone for superoxide dismutase, chloroplastic/cytosolic n=1 Tax=Sesamum radiatum TaxID=300843 RepID=A0AAW2L0D8_SESRA